ncbi:hypothetical protein QCE83_19490 [Caballeronia sp. LZ034LL]|nr:hypothetical protein [Caballeronia sp. LZ034LL]
MTFDHLPAARPAPICIDNRFDHCEQHAQIAITSYASHRHTGRTQADARLA